MIVVRLFGGAKKSLSTDKLELDRYDFTISELLDYLQTRIVKNLPSLDTQNILVAINGVDSSTLEGLSTKLKDGDVISIIPIIHGGSQKRFQFKIFDTTINLIGIKRMHDPIMFLESLRTSYADLVIQGIRSRYILNLEHAKKIISISLAAQKDDIMLSNKLETDILMRFALTKQIDTAIKKIGLEQNQDSILIIIGKKSQLDKLVTEIHSHMKSNVFVNNINFLKKEFEISIKQLQSITSKTPLEDLLAEKAAILFR